MNVLCNACGKRNPVPAKSIEYLDKIKCMCCGAPLQESQQGIKA